MKGDDPGKKFVSEKQRAHSSIILACWLSVAPGEVEGELKANVKEQ